ncbi:DAK2 domain-containing protein [Crossiella sp. CA-258035]|uniref:DAK2 domain-containing protein n=1 Tax=Crossiella sp. CA-258035 TaxID=2981138 RepID=UPI0024BCB896|nr:DAK2 domain-containing protein [Crossiella sp. CA-258035]WHT23707.1 DAK2 domain-containing protein [Crossiella sp. CA-258035]
MQVLDAVAVRGWAVACVEALAADREAIDRINVFPVPDGDTGSNLLHTMRAALDTLTDSAAADGGAALAALAKGALAGARGNSGVILSQVLRGLAEALRQDGTLTGPALKDGLRLADRLATAAVSEPAPGTVLTVMHAAAEAATAAGESLEQVAFAASTAAAEALARTPSQLPALARAGVVDAGGRGLLVLLETLTAVVTGLPLPPSTRFDALVRRGKAELQATREAGSAEFDYEVMYLLDGTDETRTAALRARLGELGDCVSVVSDGAGLWTVHVHCQDVGAAIEAGVEAGRPHRITVIRFADQLPTEPTGLLRDRAVVVLADGEGLAELFRGEGAVVCQWTGQRPTAAELLATLTGAGAKHIVVLPNDAELTVIAEDAAEHAMRSGYDVVVVPTASPVQGLAALAVHDPQRRHGDDVVAMAEAAAATRRGELAVAEEDAITWAGRCRPGDLLGMIDREVVLIGSRPAEAVCELLDRMLSAGGELVTLLLGESAPPELVGEVEEHLRRAHPEVDLASYPGGSRGAMVLLGIE